MTVIPNGLESLTKNRLKCQPENYPFDILALHYQQYLTASATAMYVSAIEWIHTLCEDIRVASPAVYAGSTVHARAFCTVRGFHSI